MRGRTTAHLCSLQERLHIDAFVCHGTTDHVGARIARETRQGADTRKDHARELPYDVHTRASQTRIADALRWTFRALLRR